MMISQPAIMCLNATWQRLTGRLARSAALTAEQPLPEPALAELNRVGADVAAESLLVSAAAGESESLAAEAREQRPARPARPDASMPLAANERIATRFDSHNLAVHCDELERKFRLQFTCLPGKGQ